MDPTAAPVDLILGGTLYQAHPLRDIDHETLNKWVRKEYVKRIEESIADSPDLQRLALSNLAIMDWMSGDGLHVTLTIAGIHRLAELLTRQKIPYDVMKESEALDTVYNCFMELHAVEESGGSSSEDPKQPE